MDVLVTVILSPVWSPVTTRPQLKYIWTGKMARLKDERSADFLL